MQFNKRKLVTNAMWAAVTLGIAAYALRPAIGNQFGSVKPAHERTSGLSLELSTLQGDTWSLANYRGKVVLVNFWATWCPPCRIETPDLVATHRKFAGEGFTVVGVTLDETPAEAVPPFIQRYSIPYPILLPSEEVGAEISTLPTSMLIDAQGRVARTYVGIVTESALQRDVGTLLKERGDWRPEEALNRAK